MAVRKGSKDKLAPLATDNGDEAVANPEEGIATVPPGEEISVSDFGLLAVTMSRLLTEFSEVKPLRDAGLGLGDWAVLAMLAQSDGMTKKLSRGLGIPLQRVTNIVALLEQDELVSVGPAVSGGKAKRLIKISEAGRAKLESVNAELTVALDLVLKSPALRGALKQMSVLERLLGAATFEKDDTAEA